MIYHKFTDYVLLECDIKTSDLYYCMYVNPLVFVLTGLNTVQYHCCPISNKNIFEPKCIRDVIFQPLGLMMLIQPQAQFLVVNLIEIYRKGLCPKSNSLIISLMHVQSIFFKAGYSPLPPEIKHERLISLQLQPYLGSKGLNLASRIFQAELFTGYFSFLSAINFQGNHHGNGVSFNHQMHLLVSGAIVNSQYPS